MRCQPQRKFSQLFCWNPSKPRNFSAYTKTLGFPNKYFSVKRWMTFSLSIERSFGNEY
jgi:hypothetical protein